MTEPGRPAFIPSPPDFGADAVVVLVGVTAGWRKRRAARRWLQTASPIPVILPRLRYGFGLAACARSLRRSLAEEVAAGGHRRVHLLCYIAGGAVLREWPEILGPLRPGRILWDRGPLQEQVAPRLTARLPALVRRLPWICSMADLARLWSGPPPRWPASDLGQAVLVERRPSWLARRLGLDESSVPPDGWSFAALGPPGALGRALPLSHDRVYDDPGFLAPALGFLLTGRFPEAPDA